MIAFCLFPSAFPILAMILRHGMLDLGGLPSRSRVEVAGGAGLKSTALPANPAPGRVLASLTERLRALARSAAAEDASHVNSFTRRLRGTRYRHRHARGDTDARRLPARSTHSLSLPIPLVLCLFGLLGLLLAGLIVLIIAPEYLTWALSLIV